MTRARALRAAAVALAGAFLAACSLFLPEPAAWRYYVLDPAAPRASGGVAPLPADVSIGLGPLSIADYLQRPELVTRVSATEIRPSAIDRWGEPLTDALPRVLAADLGAALGPRRFARYPWFTADRPDVQLELSVERFERDGEGDAVLVARYLARDLRGDGGRSVTRDVQLRRRPADAATATAVAAMSENVAELSRQMAAAVSELATTP